MREEWLLAHDPRHARGGVRDPAKVRAECAVVVGAQCGAQEETVAPGKLLLNQTAYRPVVRVRLTNGEASRRPVQRTRAGEELRSESLIARDLLFIELRADRRACMPR